MELLRAVLGTVVDVARKTTSEKIGRMRSVRDCLCRYTGERSFPSEGVSEK